MKALKLSIHDGGIIEINDELAALQEAVGGYIECKHLRGKWLREDCCMILDEEGKIHCPPSPRNPAATAIYRIATGVPDYIAGDVLIAGVDGDGFCSIPESVLLRVGAIANAAYKEAEKRGNKN